MCKENIESKEKEISNLFIGLPDKSKDRVLDFISYLYFARTKTEHNLKAGLSPTELTPS